MTAHSFQQSLVCESYSGVGFEIGFEIKSRFLAGKGGVEDEEPRLLFCGVRGFAGVVVCDASIEVGRVANVTLIEI